MRLRWCVLCVVLVLLAPTFVLADGGIGPRLQEVCVTIQRGVSDRGSGTIITRKVEDKLVNFVLTAEHVVADLREVRSVITADGSDRKAVSYRDATILQEIREGGRTVGEIRIDAKVLNVDSRSDLALLRIRKAAFVNVSGEFYLGDKIPEPGTKIYHCASPAGQINAASLTSGIVAQVGRRIAEYGGSERGIYDQVTTPALPGSSGGMIALQENGEIVGVLTLGLRGTDNFHYIVPVRRIKDWAEAIKVEWLLDPKGKTTEAALEKIPLERSLPGFGAKPTPADRERRHMDCPTGAVERDQSIGREDL